MQNIREAATDKDIVTQTELLRKSREKSKPAQQSTLQERYENLDPQKKEELKRRVENRKLQDKKKGSIMYKISDNAKKVWNGDKRLGKVGNRAAIIGTGAAIGATAYGIHKARQNRKNKKKENKD